MVAPGRLISTIILYRIHVGERVFVVTLLIGVVAVVNSTIVHVILRSLSVISRVGSSAGLIHLLSPTALWSILTQVIWTRLEFFTMGPLLTQRLLLVIKLLIVGCISLGLVLLRILLGLVIPRLLLILIPVQIIQHLLRSLRRLGSIVLLLRASGSISSSLGVAIHLVVVVLWRSCKIVELGLFHSI